MTGKSLKDLQDLGYVPPLYEMELGRTIGVDDFLQLSPEEVEELDVPLVVPGAKWVASDQPLQAGLANKNSSVYSGNGEIVWKVIRQKKLTVFQVGDSALLPVTYIPSLTKQKSKEELYRMSQDLNSLAGGASAGAGSLDELANSLGNTGVQNTQAMNQFNAEGGAAAEGGEATTGGLKAEITAQLDRIKIADPTALQLNNRKLGRLIGFVTNQDKRIEFTTTSEPLLDQGKHVLKPTAPENVRVDFTRGEKVAKKYLQETIRLKVRQAKPGKILGAVISIPAGGLVDMMRFREGGKIVPDTTKNDLVFKIFPKEVYPTILDFYFGDRIIESAETHGGQDAAGEVEQKATVRFKTKEGNATGQQVISRSLKPTKRKSLLINTNYFPIKTYETITIGAAQLSADQVDTLNESSFISLISAKASAGSTSNKFEMLSPDDKALVQREGNGRIVSKFFTNDVNNRVALEVKPFFSKDAEPIETVEVPVKIRKATKDGGVVYRYVTYSATDEKVLEDPTMASKTSLNSGRFGTIVKAAGGSINIDSLRELTRRSGGAGKGGKNANLSNEALIKLQLGLAGSELHSEDIEFRDAGIGDYASLSKAIDELIYA